MAFVAPLIAGAKALIGGLSLQSAGSLLTGAAGLASGIYQMNVANMNAKIAEENAQRRIQQGQTEQVEQDAVNRQLFGEQESIQAASGLSLSSQSSIRTRKAARELGRLDSLRIRENADWDAYNYRVEAANQKAQAGMAGLQGGMSMLQGFLGAKTSMIGSSASTKKSFDPWITKKGTNMRRMP